RTAYALHLYTIADIYSGSAYLYALLPFDTVSFLNIRLTLSQFPPRLPPLLVVDHGHALLIEQYTLQPTIRTYRRADDLPYIGKDTIKYQCKNDNGNETTDMLFQRIGHDLEQRI